MMDSQRYKTKHSRRLSGAEQDDNLRNATVSPFGGSFQFRLTPDRLVRTISAADAGDPREQMTLFSTIIEKEPILGAHLQTRKLGVLSRAWYVRSKQHADIALEIDRLLVDVGLRGAMSTLLDAIGYGYAGVVVDWLPGGSGIAGFVNISQDRWLFDAAGNPALMGQLGKEAVPLSAYHRAQIMYMQADRSGLPCRAGLLRALLWLHVFKTTGFRDWNRYLERFGMPYILGRIPSGDYADEGKRDKLLRSLLNIRSDGVGVGTTETDMQLLTAPAGGTDAYAQHQRYCDELITLMVLGQLASSATSSGLSKGGLQESVRQDLMISDSSMLQQVIQSTIINPLCQMKYGLTGHDIGFYIDCEDQEDLNLRADRDTKLALAAGKRLGASYIMETYGVPLEDMPTPGNAQTTGA